MPSRECAGRKAVDLPVIVGPRREPDAHGLAGLERDDVARVLLGVAVVDRSEGFVGGGRGLVGRRPAGGNAIGGEPGGSDQQRGEHDREAGASNGGVLARARIH